MQPVPPCPAPTHWWPTRASGLLLCWDLQFGAYSVCVCVFSAATVALWDSKTPHRPTSERVSCCFETSTPSELPHHSGVSVPNSFVSFCLLYFVLPPFKENGLPFWVPSALYQCLEVVLSKLLSIQMIFWWICRGESGVPVLFLYRLGF